jgi:hypothetical protein
MCVNMVKLKVKLKGTYLCYSWGVRSVVIMLQLCDTFYCYSIVILLQLVGTFYCYSIVIVLQLCDMFYCYCITAGGYVPDRGDAAGRPELESCLHRQSVGNQVSTSPVLMTSNVVLFMVQLCILLSANKLMNTSHHNIHVPYKVSEYITAQHTI